MVTLPRAIYAAMLAHVQAGYPNEACGVLASAEGSAVATHHFPTRNAAADTGGDPETFSVIAPQDLLAIWDAIDTNDWTMLAYYHSHPATEAYPSPRDIRYAQGWPGTYYLIFSLRDPATPALRAFLITGEDVVEELVQIDEQAS